MATIDVKQQTPKKLTSFSRPVDCVVFCLHRWLGSSLSLSLFCPSSFCQRVGIGPLAEKKRGAAIRVSFKRGQALATLAPAFGHVCLSDFLTFFFLSLIGAIFFEGDP